MRSDCIEVWKSVVGFEGYYEVSDHGRVKSLSRKGCREHGCVTYSIKTDRYLAIHECMVTLVKGSGRYKRLVYRLVLEAFVGPCPIGMIACHFPDRDRSNNRLDNLMWGTYQENESHKTIHGTKAVGVKNGGGVKMSEEKVRQLRTMYADGLYSQQSLASLFEISLCTVQRILYRKNWKHVD